MNKDIFTKNFTGSIDDLLNHCDNNAEFVSDVIEGKKDFVLTDEESIVMIKEEFPNISDELANKFLQEMKLEQTIIICEKMKKEGLIETKGYNKDGEEILGLTKLGEEYYNKIKNN